jgi:hypothetical protein
MVKAQATFFYCRVRSPRMIFILAINRDFDGLSGYSARFSEIVEATRNAAPIIWLPPYLRLQHPSERAQLKVVPPRKSIPNHVNATLTASIPVPAESFGLNAFGHSGVLLHHEDCIACDHLDIMMVNDGFYVVVVQRDPKCYYLVEHGQGSYWYTDQEAAVKRSDSVQGTVTRYVEDINWHL